MLFVAFSCVMPYNETHRSEENHIYLIKEQTCKACGEMELVTMNYSVFDSDPYTRIMFQHERETDPDKPRKPGDLSKKLNEQFSNDMEMAKQRATQGFCDRDLWDIGAWFLGLMPVMLQRYKETRHGSPVCLGEDYTDADGILRNDACHAEWDKILDEMIFLFREALEETCSRKNPYADEHTRQFSEFEERFGMLGEKLQTEEELARHARTGDTTVHFMSELSEYQEIDEKYKAAEKELEEYREQCRMKAMELFTEWMPHLWD